MPDTDFLRDHSLAYIEMALRTDRIERVTNLETLPKDHFHCAELAVGALYLALADLIRNKT